MNTTSAPSARSASATASAGTTCPAVPPAPITIGVGVTRWGLHHRKPLAGSRDVEDQADRGEHHTQIRRRIVDERQWDAGERRKAQHDEDVENSLAQDQRGEAASEQLGISI